MRILLFALILVLFPCSVICVENPAPIVDEFSDDAWDEFSDEIEDEYTGPLINDSLEPVNRAIFWFNDKLYFYAIKPASKVYRILPKRVRIAIKNFFSNLSAPVRIVNSGLQMKFDDAGRELLRFTVNSTVGLGGLFDQANKYGGIREKNEDFGQTLGHYGVGPGYYLVIPFLGASSVRDGLGDITDTFFDPLYVNLDEGETFRAKTLETVNHVSLDKDSYEKIKRENIDPYSFIKNAYTQRQRSRIED